MRALAHPRRLRIHHFLDANGPATSAILARELGLNTGATSYHLRELAEHGFVEEVAEQAHGRERWWRAVEMDLRFAPASQQSDEMRAVLDEMNRLTLAADLELFARFQLTRDDLGAWVDTMRFSRGSINVTAADFDAFFEDYIALLNRYAHTAKGGTAETRSVAVRLVTFPAPNS
jgi:DNA-binding MarR family transcriptional regulator